MKKRTWIFGTAVILMVVLAATMIWVDRSEIIVRAEAGNGNEVILPHIHSEEGGACYHQHGNGCYTVPVICNGSITQKRGSVCGTLRKWTGTDDRGITFTYAQCNACGQFWDHVGDDMGDYHYHYDWTCDSCGARYEGGGTCRNIARYDIGCNKDEHTFECEDVTCGSYHITCNDIAAGLESTTLTANITSQEAGASVTSYQWSTGDTSQTITVTQNGTYSCEITYTDIKSGAGSTAEAFYEVTNLDNIPPEVALSCAPSSPTNTGTTIHIDASDNVGVTGYSFDGVTFSEEQDLYVTENGSYMAYATDASGNIGSAVITVDNIDHKAPIVSVTKSTEATYVNGELQINVTAEDVVSDGYACEISVRYSADGDNWSDSGEFCLTLDGTREIFARDAAGNISTAPVTVYQDTTPPCISSTQNPQGWTKDAVCLALTASDDQSGIPEWAYKWMDGDWNLASYINVTANGSYPVTVRDAAGNTAAYTFHVTQIDRTAPKLEAHLGTADWYDGTNIIYAQASDSESGLADEPYSFDGGATWTASAQYEISETGEYLVLVRDAVGNIAEGRIYADKMAVTPNTDENWTEPESEAEEYYSHWNKKEVTGEVPMPSDTASDVDMPPMIQTILPVTEPNQNDSVPKIILSISIPRSASLDQGVSGVSEGELAAMLNPQTSQTAVAAVLEPWNLKILVAVICGIGCLGGLFFLLWTKQKAALYEQEPGNTGYHLVDRLKINRRSEGKGYVIKITDRQLAGRITESVNKQEQAVRHYILKFGRHFAKWHKEEKLEILLCTGDWMYEKVEREVKL